jgi:hypothetical protein
MKLRALCLNRGLLGKGSERHSELLRRGSSDPGGGRMPEGAPPRGPAVPGDAFTRGAHFADGSGDANGSDCHASDAILLQSSHEDRRYCESECWTIVGPVRTK